MADDAAPPPPDEIISETGPEVSSVINAAPGSEGGTTAPAPAGAPAGPGQQATAPGAPVPTSYGPPPTGSAPPGQAASPYAKYASNQNTGQGGVMNPTTGKAYTMQEAQAAEQKGGKIYTNVGTGRPGEVNVSDKTEPGKVNSPSEKGSSYRDQQGYTGPADVPGARSGPGYGGGTASNSGRSGPGYGGGSAPKGPLPQTAEELKQMKDEDSERNIKEAQKKAEDAKRIAGPPPTSGKMAPAPAAPSNKVVNLPSYMMPHPGGAGPQKRAFFQAQADTLNAMLPYYKMAQGG
jgi:hypothetical protein